MENCEKSNKRVVPNKRVARIVLRRTNKRAEQNKRVGRKIW